MSNLVPVLSEQEIDKKVSLIAKNISKDYKDKDLVLVGVLKGSFIFLADLARKLSIDCQIDFIGASSYGMSEKSSGNIKITKDINIDIKGKDLILVEDIIDTGLTVEYLKNYLKNMGAESIKVCTLIDKYERRDISLNADYACHKINEGFIVGYGIDYAEQYRNLPAIYHIKT
ncbi:MAG: hypoxanthine phosphoribosyltransferase [Deltaproteobacteria bacterium]|nr:MAG: hypoxanthine phosphoribosyltransferase [Deltaproteobacteria bacterium]